MLSNIRYALRTLLKRPGFTFVAVLTLSLGIGANTAIFSVVKGVLWQPLNYAEPDRLVAVLHADNRAVAPANYFDWRDRNQSFEYMAAAQYWQPTVTATEQPEQLLGIQATADLFRVYGVEPLLGRTFAMNEDQPDQSKVVVLGYGLWQRRFGGAADVIGQTITLNGTAHTVIGVMPAGFQFAAFWASGAELCAPLDLSPRLQDRDGQSLRIFGRLKPDLSIEQGQVEITTIMSQLEQAYPEENKGLTAHLTPLHEMVVGDIRGPLLLLFGAVGLVLLIACANVAGLLLGRAVTRQKELAIRMAVGAGRGHVIRQLLTESLLLALIGGVGGFLFALWSVDVLTAMSPDNIPRIETVGLDGRVFVFTTLLSMVVGLVFGMMPALNAARTDLNMVMQEGGRGGSEGSGRQRARGALIVGEVALALMLLIGAGLLVRSFVKLQEVAPGFDPENVLTMTVSIAGSSYGETTQRGPFFQQLIEQTEALPGVTSASLINHLPLAGDLWRLSLGIEGRPVPPPDQRDNAAFRVVAPSYFRTMDIDLKKGRDFTYRDDMNAVKTVIINETLAARYFPDGEAVGKRISIGNITEPEWLTVVGVVEDVKQAAWQETASNEAYLPYFQNELYQTNDNSGFKYMTLVARTTTAPQSMTPAIRRVVREMDADIPVSQVAVMQEVVDREFWSARFSLSLLGLFAGIALVLAAVGIYGVMAYTVTQRTREIGLRMALGASRRSVLSLVLRFGMGLTALGVVIGVGASFIATRFMAHMLYGVQATDPTAFALGVLFIMAIAFLSCYIPAWRATRVDPLVAIRQD